MSNFDYYPPRRQPATSWGPIVTLVLLIAALAGGWLLVRPWFGKRDPGTGLDPTAQPRAVTPPGDMSGDEKRNIRIFQDARASVAHITTFGLRQDYLSRDIYKIPQGSGSGFVWDTRGKTGYVVTNYHVIRNADSAEVTLLLSDGKQKKNYPGRIVGRQPDMDLAVLAIQADDEGDLKPIKVGSSADLQVGQNVYAIGNPFGLDWSLTTGVISALDRSIESVAGTPIEHVIQHQAPIIPGNSGGPLLDGDGRLIGVNTAIYSPSGASAGIGFAIPVDDVNRVVTALIRSGTPAARARLGVQVAPDDYARERGVEDGALVMGVIRGSPAERARLRVTTRRQVGDVIVALGDEPIKSAADLFAALERYQPGSTVPLTVLRDGRRGQVQVTLDSVF